MIIVDCIKQTNLLIIPLRLIVQVLKELKFKLRLKNLLLIAVLMDLRMLIMNLTKKKLIKEIQKLSLIIYPEVMEQRLTDQCQIQILRKHEFLLRLIIIGSKMLGKNPNEILFLRV